MYSLSPRQITIALPALIQQLTQLPVYRTDLQRRLGLKFYDVHEGSNGLVKKC